MSQLKLDQDFRGRLARPPLERMMRLHEQLQARRFPNCRSLAEELEVSTKTVQRDIDFMRDRMGLPIEYDQVNFGFFYSEPVTSFPNLKVSVGEVMALFVAQKALTQYKGTSFEKPLRAAFQKLTEALHEEFSFNVGDLETAISFKGIGMSVSDIELFEIVSKTVLRSSELDFEYKKLASNRHEGRRVQPYHLGCIENQWYLFAFDVSRQQLRTFVLSRMRNARDTKLKFTKPQDFSIDNHLSGSFGVFKSSRAARQTVRIEFDAFASRLVAERQWHPTQKIKNLGNGGLELSLQLGNLEEIERWVLSWGAHARVIGPKALVQRVRQAAQSLLEKH